MPNRILKESICTSDTIDQLVPEQEAFFYRLLVQCDDYGRMDARPNVLRAKLFPLRIDMISNDFICMTLATLSQADLIEVYIAEGKPFLQVKTWEKHQQVRAKKSKYPDIKANGNQLLTSDNICNQLQAYVPVIQSNPIQSLSESNPIHGGKGGEGGKRPHKKDDPIKQKFGEFGNILLTTEEYEKLTVKFGGKGRDDWIEKVSTAKKSKGLHYESDYATILNWARRDNENTQRGTREPEKHDLRAGLGGPSAIVHRP